jgi:hypothetical protein
MANRGAIVVSAGVFIIALYFLISLQSYIGIGSRSHNADHKYMPKHWNGVAISRDNNLFIAESSATKAYSEELYQEIILIPREDWDTGNWKWLFDFYAQRIGWNGVMDTFDKGEKLSFLFHCDKKKRILNLSLAKTQGLGPDGEYYHHMGELIAAAAAKPEYAVEITARSTLRKSPLHGAIWQLVLSFPQVQDPKTLFNFVDNQLCYFGNEPGFFTIWISCE